MDFPHTEFYRWHEIVVSYYIDGEDRGTVGGPKGVCYTYEVKFQGRTWLEDDDTFSSYGEALQAGKDDLNDRITEIRNGDRDVPMHVIETINTFIQDYYGVNLITCQECSCLMSHSYPEQPPMNYPSEVVDGVTITDEEWNIECPACHLKTTCHDCPDFIY